MDFSNQEKNNLAKQFLQEMAQRKALQLGVEKDDLTLKIVNGKYTWARKAQVYAQLEKQKQVMGNNKISRALRGEDSLVCKIQSELAECRSWVEKLSNASLLSKKELSEFDTALGLVQRQTQDAAVKLGDIENSIENIKQSDEIFAKAEAIFVEMRKAKEKGDNACFETIRQANDTIIKQYEERRRRLDPQLQAARQMRLVIQREYWNVLMLHWRLQDIAIQTQLGMIFDYGKEVSVEARKKLYLIDKGDVRTFLESLRASIQEYMAQLPSPRAELNATLQQYDNLILSLQAILNMQLDVYTQLKTKYGSIGEDSVTGVTTSPYRMAFADRRAR